MDSIPVLSVDLINQLDKEYPDKGPKLTMPDREIWYRVGQRSVVEKLKTILSEQESVATERSLL
jgi:hypothetical protein